MSNVRAPVLVVVAVEAERHALGGACLNCADVRTVVAGIGRTNAAVAVARGLAERPHGAVFSVGIAGSLPGSQLSIGDRVVSTECVYMEEGIQAPQGFCELASIGFSLGDFPGNRVPVSAELLRRFASLGVSAPIATVATCSGVDALAAEVVRRTGAAAEAMEGAAVVHAARIMGAPALEIRSISNATGDRGAQKWDIPAGLAALKVVGDAIAAFASAR